MNQGSLPLPWRRPVDEIVFVNNASIEETAVVGVRLPRVLVGFVVGGALAVAGTALQGLFRNPLAEPGVLGISSGASLGAVLAIYLHIAGRAVWGDAVGDLPDDVRRAGLARAAERLATLNEIVRRHGKPWTSHAPRPAIATVATALSPTWYTSYGA